MISALGTGLSFAIILVLIVVPFQKFGVPIGWDPPWYLFLARSASSTVSWYYLVPQTVIAALNALAGFLGGSTSSVDGATSFLTITQVILFMMLNVSTQYISAYLTNDPFAGAVAAILLSISTTTLRLQPNLAEIICLTLVFIAIPKLLQSIRKPTPSSLLTAISLFILALFSDALFALYFLVIISISLGISAPEVLSTVSLRRKITNPILAALVVLMVGLVALSVSLTQVQESLFIRLDTALSAVGHLSSVEQAFHLISPWYVTPIALASLTGILVTKHVIRSTLERNFLILWMAVTLSVSLLGLTSASDRVISIPPLQIEASILIIWILRIK